MVMVMLKIQVILFGLLYGLMDFGIDSLNLTIHNGHLNNRMENEQMVIVKTGNKKKAYRSIKLAAEAAGVKYITLYMRLRAGDKAVTAMKKPVRVYSRKETV
jgi:hypothetical protein